MPLPFRLPVARLALAFASLAVAAGCGDPTGPDAVSGTYAATTFRVTPTGEPTIDVLAQGGTLTLAFTGSNSVSGTLSIPASVTGDQALVASMDGTVVRTGNTIELQQSADTFVRDLTWTVGESTLQVVNQAAGSAAFTITLTRQ